MSNVVRDLVALSVLGHLMYETFFQCFESTGKATDTVVMKKYSATIRDTLFTVRIWILVPVEDKRRWSETYMPDDVLNLHNLEAGEVVRMNLPNVGRLLG